MGNTGDKSKHYEAKLLEFVEKDDRFLVMTAENRALIRNCEEKLGNRFVDTGINEQTLVGMAAGLALDGRIPVVHALAPFLTMRAFEFVRSDVGYTNLPVKLMGFIPGLLSDGNGPTHQAIEDIGLISLIPNFEIVAPASEEDLSACLEYILHNDKPTYVRLNHLPGVTKHSNLTSSSKIEKLLEGKKVAVISYGFILQQAYKAVEYLHTTHNIECSLYNFRVINPIDLNAITKIFKNYDYIIVCEDHLSCGSLFEKIQIAKTKLNRNVQLFGLNLGCDWFKAGLLESVMENTGLNSNAIATFIMKSIGYET